MFCTNCGKQIEEGNPFCPYCGREIEDAGFDLDAFLSRLFGSEGETKENAPVESSAGAHEPVRPGTIGQQPTKKAAKEQKRQQRHEKVSKDKTDSEKLRPVIVSIAAVLAIAVIGLFAFKMMQKTEVNLTNYVIAPEFAGEDGEGTLVAEAEVDWDKVNGICKAYKEKKADKIKALFQTVTWETTPSQGLSAGDTYVSKATYDKDLAKELRIDVTATVKKGTVETLTVISDSSDVQSTSETNDNNVEVVEDNSDNKYFFQNEYILPYSDSYNYSLAEIENAGLSDVDTRLAINELYARYGYIFSKPYYQNYFNSCSWYYESINGDDFNSNAYFNDYEQHNKEILLKYEEEMGYHFDPGY